MKIKKVDDKPMKLHTKGAPRLKIKRVKKPTVRRLKGTRDIRRVRTTIRHGVKSENQPIVIKRHSLYTMGRIGAKKAADQIEGGEELKESAGAMSQCH